MTLRVPKGNYDCNTYTCNTIPVDNSYLPTPNIDSYNIIKSDINELLKTIESNKTTNTESLTFNTNEYDENENRSLRVHRINEYKSVTNFHDNNVSGINEEINEYIININSVYRDCKTYPNPFNYKVNFNTEYNNNAVISKVFRNIKYIRLIHISVPKKYAITIGNYSIINTSNNIEPLVTLFSSKSSNEVISTYKKYLVTLTYLTLNYYYYYYNLTIDNIQYYFCNYILYDNKECSHKITFNLNNLTSKDIINNIFNNINNDNITYELTLIKIANWIMIDYSNNKFKFCEETTNFNEIISTTYEIIHNNTLEMKAYILQDYSLENDRYLLLDIDELNDIQQEYSTDQKVEKCFTILYNDYSFGDYFYLETYYHKRYTHTNLGCINKMSIHLKNIYGNDITPSLFIDKIIDYDITTPKDKCICTLDIESGEHIRNYTCCHSYLRHPGYEKLQNNLLFKVGILEGTIKTQRI